MSWRSPQPVSVAYREILEQSYRGELSLLQAALPSRFQPSIQACIDSLDSIMSLPMVLLHRDLTSSNIMVDEDTCHLVSVIDWAEAEVCPFGLNLDTLEMLTGKLHRRDGWIRYEDHAALHTGFWDAFSREVGGLSEQQIKLIKIARMLGLLLSRGFTSRLADQPKPVPIGDDETGRYNTLSLDGFLINPQTKFDVTG